VHWAPGIPHALILFRGGKFLHNSGASRRVNTAACLCQHGTRNGALCPLPLAYRHRTTCAAITRRRARSVWSRAIMRHAIVSRAVLRPGQIAPAACRPLGAGALERAVAHPGLCRAAVQTSQSGTF